MKRTRRLDVTGPVYKLEWFDDRLMVWKPVQKTYETAEQAARVARTAEDRTWRLMEVSQHGYRPVALP